MPSYTPPLAFTTTHTISTISLTSLSALMILTPQLYHKHIIRSANPSTTDLFISTQFTNSTQSVLHSTIRSSGILLLGTSIGLFATRHQPASFTIMASVTASVAAGHAVMLKDVIMNTVLRRSWLRETERVVKMGVVIGVNTLVAGISLWAGLSYGGWPWSVVPGYFSSPVVQSAVPVSRVADGDIDVEAIVNGVVKGAVELAGGVSGVIKGFLS
ncbi:hypothetical protein ABW19_dt0209808 [Dactylella cylindrospora]|nr:hypothetical protein ABW19_dt0209808 [Dactylella cylindrospora]